MRKNVLTISQSMTLRVAFSIKAYKYLVKTMPLVISEETEDEDIGFRPKVTITYNPKTRIVRVIGNGQGYVLKRCKAKGSAPNTIKRYYNVTHPRVIIKKSENTSKFEQFGGTDIPIHDVVYTTCRFEKKIYNCLSFTLPKKLSALSEKSIKLLKKNKEYHADTVDESDESDELEPMNVKQIRSEKGANNEEEIRKALILTRECLGGTPSNVRFTSYNDGSKAWDISYDKSAYNRVR